MGVEPSTFLVWIYKDPYSTNNGLNARALMIRIPELNNQDDSWNVSEFFFSVAKIGDLIFSKIAIASNGQSLGGFFEVFFRPLRLDPPKWRLQIVGVYIFWFELSSQRIVSFKCFLFSPLLGTWGNDPIWLIFFWNGLKPPTWNCYFIYMFRKEPTPLNLHVSQQTGKGDDPNYDSKSSHTTFRKNKFFSFL